MDKPAILALVKRLKQATGPDRELDNEIFALIHPGWFVNAGGVLENDAGGKVEWSHIHYTGSLDDALVWVPKHYDWAVYSSGVALLTPKDGMGEAYICDNAATPPLAACIAALRAVLAKGDE